VRASQRSYLVLAATAQNAPNRDKQKEDQVAKLFEDLRADAKIPPLKRIGDRASLERQVCTIAVTDTPPNRASMPIFGLYKTANQGSVTPELSKVALFNDEDVACGYRGCRWG